MGHPEMDGQPRRPVRPAWQVVRPFVRWWIIVPLILAVAYFIVLRRTERARAEQLRMVQASGGALRLAELAPVVPPGERNAANFYRLAFEALPARTDSELLDRMRQDPAFARDTLAARAPGLRLLDEASRVRHCAFPVDWNDPLGVESIHLADMRQAARLLAVRASILAEDGESDEALASCAITFRMGEHSRMEPTLIGQLSAYALQNIAVVALEECLSAGDPSPAACRNLFDQLAEIEQTGSLVRAMQGERASGIQLFEGLREGSAYLRASVAESIAAGGPEWPHWLLADLYRTAGRPLVNLDEIAFLEAMGNHISSAGMSYRDATSAEEATTARLERLPGYRTLLTDMFLPVLARAVWNRDRATARLGTAQIALALSAYHAERGRYPQSLRDLEAAGWDLPADPFTGNAFQYRRDGDGFLVWSLGPDGDDDGGRARDDPSQKPADSEDYDLPFRCAR